MRLRQWFSGGRKLAGSRLREALTLARNADLEAAIAMIPERFPQALEELRALGEPVDSGWLRLAAALEYRSGRLQEAHQTAERALAMEPEAQTWHLLGRIRTWLKRPDAADAFQRAKDLDPQGYFLPHRVKRQHFEALAEQALAEVPSEFRAHMDNTLVVVDDLPDIESVRQGEDPDVLGIYEGATAMERGLPERIVLYQRNHEQVARSEEELRAEVIETMRHEIGHHFGMEEEELPF